MFSWSHDPARCVLQFNATLNWSTFSLRGGNESVFLLTEQPQYEELVHWLYATEHLHNNWPRRQAGWPYGDLTSKARQTLGVID
jgi:hypothetical protein